MFNFIFGIGAKSSSPASPPPDPVPPDAPSGLSVVPKTGDETTQFELTWTNNSATYHHVRIESAPDNSGLPGDYALLGEASFGVASENDGEFPPGVTRWYRIRAENSGGLLFSDWVESSGATQSLAQPGSFDSSTSMTTTSLHLTWTDSNTSEDGYEVRIGTTDVFDDALMIADLAPDTTTVDLEDLEPGVHYFLWVTAYVLIDDAKFYSGWADGSSWTTVAVHSSEGDTTWTQGGGSVFIDELLTIDGDTDVNVLGISIDGYDAGSGDVLSAPTLNGNPFSWNPDNGNLSWSGVATPAEAQAGLRLLAFDNSSESPNPTTRSIVYNVYTQATSRNDFTSKNVAIQLV